MTVSLASFSEVDDAATLNPRAKISSDMSPNTLINQSILPFTPNSGLTPLMS